MEVTEIFGESLETLSAVESQSWVSFYFLDYRFFNLQGLASVDFFFGGGVFVYLFHFRPYFIRASFLC